MAKRRIGLDWPVTPGKQSYIFYGAVCAACIGAGAYIGHSSIQDTASFPELATTTDNASPVSQSLEIKYAYFGAPAIRMPSEQETILTPSRDTAVNTQVEPEVVYQALVAKEAPKQGGKPAPVATPPAATAPREAPTVAKQAEGTQVATIAKGDSFSTIGQRFGLSVREAANIMKDKVASKHLATIYPGKQITFKSNKAREVEQIIYVIDDTRTLVLDRLGEADFTATLDEVALERRILVKSGVVENSLFVSATEAGVSNRHTMQMVEIFRWDVDFAMDVQPNDSFKVVYEGFFKGDQLARTGKLLGVEFRGRSTHQALYFEDADGEGAYYTPRGRQLEKQFLRNPVDTVRITSPFNPKRKHPVLNTIKAHKGVDYGAPIGTPIKATADGIIKYSGRRGSYGLTVELQHGKKYTTLYAHMSKIHKAATVGKPVKQGQVIGYVGKTGRVTGAHLHYEFRIRGVHVNPQTVKFAGAGSLPKGTMNKFKTATAHVMQQLAETRPQRLALQQELTQ